MMWMLSEEILLRDFDTDVCMVEKQYNRDQF
jgi:hypothetical protein